jgi:hypothetical protein
MKRSDPSTFKFALDVWVKDGKYKYLLANIDNTNLGTGDGLGIMTSAVECPHGHKGASKGQMNDFWKSAKEIAATNTNALIQSLKAAMTSKDPSQF